MQSFVSGPLFISIRLFYSRHTKLPGQKCIRPRRRRWPRPASGATSASHGHVQRARPRRRRRPRPPARPRRRRRPRPPARPHRRLRLRPASGAAGAVPALAVVAVPAGGASSGYVPRARRRRCCGPLLRRGRPSRWRPPRPRLCRRCTRRNSTAGNLPKAYQIMRNDATWKMNRYLCRVKIHNTMGVSRSNTHANLQDSETRKCP